MNKKFISVFMIGAATLATLGTVTSCKDYDDDIKDLQEQIDATGVDLNAEVTRLQGVLDTNKAACEKADAELADAIKNATNDANGYAEIQAAEAKKAAVDASKALIEQAIEDLKNGEIQAAQSKADAAYSLAEQAKAAAATNKSEIEKLATALGETNTNLQSALDKIADTNDKLAATNAELAAVKSDLAAANKQIQDNKAALSTLESSLKSLQESNDKAHKALSDKDDELKGLIETNQADIKTIVETTIPAIDSRLKTAEETIKKHTSDISTNANNIKTNKTAIEDIQKDIRDNVKPDIKANANDIKTLQSDVTNINKYLDVLNENLNNLITGLIFQDEQLEIVQAKVVSDVNKTGITGKTFTEASGSKTIVYFPYKGAADAQSNLVVDKWNVERLAGPVYYTINPTNVNFTDKANINLENSLMAAPANVEISAPEASTRKSPITRAAEGAPANGLYQSALTKKDVLRDAKHPGFANSYALFTRYNQKDKEGKVTVKSVYSKYALDINVVDAGVQTAPDIQPVGADGSYPAAVCDARFTTDFGQAMTGTFKLTPENTEFGKTGATPKVYRKYVEVINIWNSRNVQQTGTTFNNLKKAIEDANKGILNTVFEEDSEGFDQVTVTIPDASGSYNFIGSTVEFRYFIQNYDGTIYSKNIKVMFVKTLFAEAEVTIEHTPYQSGDNAMLHGLKATDKTDFQTEANCIVVSASNKLWYENTSKIEIEALGTDFCKIKTIEFRSDEKTANPKWIAETPIATINMNENKKANVDGLAVNDVKKIKNMVFTYDPASIKVETEYAFEMCSYDLNGNLVSKLPIKFVMKYPNHHLELIKPNPAFFTPYDKNMKEAKDLAGKTLTAWANKYNSPSTDVYNATYNIIAAFNDPWSNSADGCVMSFDYTDKKDYELTNSQYKQYKPINAWRLNYVTTSTDYTMEVPALAVKYQSEHEYTLQVAVENYGVPSLWYAPYEFKVVFKSAIAWADVKFDNNLYEVEYPSSSITIGDDKIVADDPSTSKADDITYFGASRDARIKSTSVALKDVQFASLFKTVAVTDGGIVIETAETIPGGVGSITTDAVTFTFSVEDYYGNVRPYYFNVKVKENVH